MQMLPSLYTPCTCSAYRPPPCIRCTANTLPPRQAGRENDGDNDKPVSRKTCDARARGGRRPKKEKKRRHSLRELKERHSHSHSHMRYRETNRTGQEERRCTRSITAGLSVFSLFLSFLLAFGECGTPQSPSVCLFANACYSASPLLPGSNSSSSTFWKKAVTHSHM
mmetsp:Transcript_13950/g.27883  ORF Transcript_13950/g.27883 Transcript_13950/m.27883 type:complete len:167 (-) Transcript_13950:91-591(-)